MPVYTTLFPDLVSHFFVIQMTAAIFKKANNGLTQSINYPFTFL